MAYDAWGGSWGTSWALSWTGEHSPTPPPVIVTPEGGGASRKRRKTRIIKFSDFAARDEYERTLKAAISEAVIVSKKPAPKSAQQPVAKQATDTAIQVSPEVMAKLQMMKDDEAAIMLMLMTVL